MAPKKIIPKNRKAQLVIVVNIGIEQLTRGENRRDVQASTDSLDIFDQRRNLNVTTAFDL